MKKSPDRRSVWVPAIVIEPLSFGGKLELQCIYDNEVHFVYSLITIREYGSKKD